VTTSNTDSVAALIDHLNSHLEGRLVTMRDPVLWLGDEKLGIQVRRFENLHNPGLHQLDVDVTSVESVPVQSVGILIREVNTRQVIKSVGFHKSGIAPRRFFAIGEKLSPAMTYTLEAVKASR
jgi:hypothetical protein